MTVPAAAPIKADRLKELRGRVASGSAPTIGERKDLLALIDSALQPASTGEIGEIVEGLRASLQVSRRNGRGDEVKCYERAIAHLLALSHPGEQQQLREALVDLRATRDRLVSAAQDAGTRISKLEAVLRDAGEWLECDEPSTEGAALRERIANLSAHKASAPLCLQCEQHHESLECPPHKASDVTKAEVSIPLGTITHEMIHKMCHYLNGSETDGNACKKCPAITSTPYGDGELGCYGIAAETLQMARSMMYEAAQHPASPVTPELREAAKAPDGYAYVYREYHGDTIYFGSGGERNGKKPIAVIPLFYGERELTEHGKYVASQEVARDHR